MPKSKRNDYVRDIAGEAAVQQAITVQEAMTEAARFLLGIGINGDNYGKVAQYQRFAPPGKGSQVSVHIPGIRELGDYGQYVAVTGSGKTAQDAERSYDVNLVQALRANRVMHRNYGPAASNP